VREGSLELAVFRHAISNTRKAAMLSGASQPASLASPPQEHASKQSTWKEEEV
jgi:hypothetical protein